MCRYHTSTLNYTLKYYYTHCNDAAAAADGCADYTDDSTNNAGCRTHNYTHTYYRTHHDEGYDDYTDYITNNAGNTCHYTHYCRCKHTYHYHYHCQTRCRPQ